jgi:hypothetical protein
LRKVSVAAVHTCTNSCVVSVVHVYLPVAVAWHQRMKIASPNWPKRKPFATAWS